MCTPPSPLGERLKTHQSPLPLLCTPTPFSFYFIYLFNYFTFHLLGAIGQKHCQRNTLIRREDANAARMDRWMNSWVLCCVLQDQPTKESKALADSQMSPYCCYYHNNSHPQLPPLAPLPQKNQSMKEWKKEWEREIHTHLERQRERPSTAITTPPPPFGFCSGLVSMCLWSALCNLLSHSASDCERESEGIRDRVWLGLGPNKLLVDAHQCVWVYVSESVWVGAPCWMKWGLLVGCKQPALHLHPLTHFCTLTGEHPCELTCLPGTPILATSATFPRGPDRCPSTCTNPPPLPHSANFLSPPLLTHPLTYKMPTYA